jgi:hypothetical protein
MYNIQPADVREKSTKTSQYHTSHRGKGSWPQSSHCNVTMITSPARPEKKGHSARPRHSGSCTLPDPRAGNAPWPKVPHHPKDLRRGGVGFPNLYCNMAIIVRQQAVIT